MLAANEKERTPHNITQLANHRPSFSPVSPRTAISAANCLPCEPTCRSDKLEKHGRPSTSFMQVLPAGASCRASLLPTRRPGPARSRSTRSRTIPACPGHPQWVCHWLQALDRTLAVPGYPDWMCRFGACWLAGLRGHGCSCFLFGLLCGLVSRADSARSGCWA